jgi:hypothetical protein
VGLTLLILFKLQTENRLRLQATERTFKGYKYYIFFNFQSYGQGRKQAALVLTELGLAQQNLTILKQKTGCEL